MVCYKYAILDETRHYTDPDLIAKCGGKIYGVYVFDADKVVHCCEITPSFELVFLRAEPKDLPENEDEREDVLTTLLECDSDSPPVVYQHAHTINAEACQEVGFDVDEDHTEDDLIEWCQGNWTARLPSE